MNTKQKILTWLKAAWNRCIRTVAQTAIAAIGTAAILSEVDVKYVLSASALAGILSLLTSLSGLPEVDEEEALDTMVELETGVLETSDESDEDAEG